MLDNSIPIFDSLTHPTLDGNWIMPRYSRCAYIDELLRQMKDNNIKAAFAVGMENIGSYDEKAFLHMLSNEKMLFPIAFFMWNPFEMTKREIKSRLLKIKRMGYVGIKLHPRLAGFTLDNEYLPVIIDTANSLGLVVLLCTYFYSNVQSYLQNNIDRLGNLLLNIDSDSRLILLHGGTVRLLETMEIARAFPNVILDLSLTMCKYEGSSLDADIAFMFRNFDRRICIGSDFPEINLSSLRRRFDYFAQDTPVDKAENIAYKNIENYIECCKGC